MLIDFRAGTRDRNGIQLAALIHFPTQTLASCADAEVLSVVALDATGTRWRVTFAEPMVDNPPLRWTGTYEFRELDELGEEVYGGHSPDVLAVSPQNVANPTYVDLTTEETRIGTDYYLALLRPEPA